MDELIGLALKNFTVTMLILGFIATAISLFEQTAHSNMKSVLRA
ncbi:hypothetical protein [Hydrogenovibrio marinus]|nr:hypothetical protein [Hydrogenovibrio marinus]